MHYNIRRLYSQVRISLHITAIQPGSIYHWIHFVADHGYDGQVMAIACVHYRVVLNILYTPRFLLLYALFRSWDSQSRSLRFGRLAVSTPSVVVGAYILHSASIPVWPTRVVLGARVGLDKYQCGDKSLKWRPVRLYKFKQKWPATSETLRPTNCRTMCSVVSSSFSLLPRLLSLHPLTDA